MFSWIPLYEEIARKVLKFENDQGALIAVLKRLEDQGLKVISPQDEDANGAKFPLEEIDPFTFFASFNRPITAANRRAILLALKSEFGVTADVPAVIDGIPLISPQNAWFFAYAPSRQADDVAKLWALAKETVSQTRNTFTQSVLDAALTVRQCGLAKLTMGMFWLNPRSYLAAEKHNVESAKRAGIAAPQDSAGSYLTWLGQVIEKVGDDLPTISRKAYDLEPVEVPKPVVVPPPVVKAARYTKADALADLFANEAELDTMLARLRRKKNLVLTGPPGVGKTFVAKRLAYVAMGERDESRVAMVQFHQSYSYEDFIQGFRPREQGGFQRKDGIFFEFARRAQRDPGRDYFFIIDEINRGNLSKIFGELMMLLEADKRGPEHALPLTYAESGADTFYLPANLHLIGTMNTADRSLSLVDYALRRRFAFFKLEPKFGSARFGDWLRDKGADSVLVEKIQHGMQAMNQEIAATPDLGGGFCIGHSYFCPPDGIAPDDIWFEDVLDAEIGPLLEEYFEKPETARELLRKLRA